MNVLKIGIVEDELIIADNIVRTLTDIGYETTEVAISYSEAVVMLQDETPDLVLLDINLSGKKDGIEVANYINEKQKTPFIFLTANSDIATLERAKKVNPNAYLLKPFTKQDLYVAIEVAISNATTNQQQVLPSKNVVPSANQLMQDAIFIKDKQTFIRVLFTEILFAESNGNYVNLHLVNGTKVLHRSTLADFAELLPAGNFFKCHRSYVVRLQAIEKIENTNLTVGGQQISISKEYVESLMVLLGIRS
jgi:DNA-binding LytR/AlgR family response regulator